MVFRKLVLTLALLTLGVSAAPAADVEGPQIRFSPHVGGGFWSEDLQLGQDILFGARAALLPSKYFGIEGTLDFSPTHFESTPDLGARVTHLGGNGILNLLPDRRFNPYLTGGWSMLHFNPESGQEEGFQGWEVGGGLKYRLVGTDGRQVDLRLDARHISANFESGSGWTKGNILVAAGVEVSLGGPGKDTDLDGVPDRRDDCPETPYQALVDDLGCSVDTDLDGVPNGIDACASTPEGAQVDPLGCAVDDDNDGVANGIDQCVDTVAGARVDLEGCALDADTDGVPDGVDTCPDTPAMVQVDATGCALDTDGDGVFDGLDFCPDTPEGLEVDADGCALDKDQDGVLDTGDACPGTPAGVNVDESGCPFAESEQEQEFLDTGLLRMDNVYFESGKAVLKSSSHAALDQVGAILVKWPQLRIEIGGHTDSQGGEELNLNLSQQRAQSVYDYIAVQFPQIELEQFSVRGYGESNSIATNDTAAGRARNRRVEFTVLNREVLAR